MNSPFLEYWINTIRAQGELSSLQLNINKPIDLVFDLPNNTLIKLWGWCSYTWTWLLWLCDNWSTCEEYWSNKWICRASLWRLLFIAMEVSQSWIVLFLWHPQNHTRKCLCNLQTLKPCRVNIPSSFDVFIVPELLLDLKIQPISCLDVAFHW